MSKELMNFEGVQLPDIMSPSDEALTVFERPISIRALCQGKPTNHRFSLDGKTNEGTKLFMQLVAVNPRLGIRPSKQYKNPTDFMQFLGLMFFEADSNRKIWADCTFASSSYEEADSLLKTIKATGKGSPSFVIEANIEPAKNKEDQEFGVVKFTLHKASKHDIQDLKEAAQSALMLNPKAFETFNELPNIDEDE